MTENKKKATKKEVVEKSDAPVKEAKKVKAKAKTKEITEVPEIPAETSPSPEIASLVVEEP
jgi:hypothetical protein